MYRINISNLYCFCTNCKIYFFDNQEEILLLSSKITKKLGQICLQFTIPTPIHDINCTEPNIIFQTEKQFTNHNYTHTHTHTHIYIRGVKSKIYYILANHFCEAKNAFSAINPAIQLVLDRKENSYLSWFYKNNLCIFCIKMIYRNVNKIIVGLIT